MAGAVAALAVGLTSGMLGGLLPFDVAQPIAVGVASIFGLSTFYQYLFNGGVLILAVGLSTVARRYATR